MSEESRKSRPSLRTFSCFFNAEEELDVSVDEDHVLIEITMDKEEMGVFLSRDAVAELIETLRSFQAYLDASY